MSYSKTMKEIGQRREQIMALRAEIRTLQSAVEPQVVQDYLFRTAQGSASLGSLFDGRDTLFVVHNMGKSCPSCTQWADGFNGVLDHLLDSAAFVVSSPDVPEVQQAFALSRGWRFPIVSVDGTDFAQDMGYFREGYWPGVSVFQRRDAQIVRVSDTVFGPGDDFNVVYAFLDLTPEGGDDWMPRYTYGREE